MYDSYPTSVLLDDQTKSQRTKILCRLYGLDFNLIPMNGKKPCVEWKPYQTRQVTPAEIKEWMQGWFPTKDGENRWKAKILNFALLTGAAPWAASNPGIVAIDPDDDEADEMVRRHCPPTPMIQRTGSGGLHRVYRRPRVEDVPYIGNRQKTWIGGRQYNLDVRGDGGYIMAPGSIHPTTGKLYVEEVPWTLELLMQCPVYDPGWLICEHAGKPKSRRTTVVVSASIDAPDHDDLISEVEVSAAERERQARIYLEAVPGTQEGTGADRSCTALTMRLLYGFALPADTVLEMLAEWGQKADQFDTNGGWWPWTEEEVSRKIEWCLRHEYNGEVGDRLHACREMDAGIDEIVLPFDDNLIHPAAEVVDVVISPKDQLDTAAQFFKSEFDGKTLVHHHGCWYRWSGQRYEVFSDDDIRARTWKWLAKCRWSKPCGKNKSRLERYQPNRPAVTGVLDALKAVANHTSTVEPPCWLDSDDLPDPTNVIAFQTAPASRSRFPFNCGSDNSLAASQSYPERGSDSN